MFVDVSITIRLGVELPANYCSAGRRAPEKRFMLGITTVSITTGLVR